MIGENSYGWNIRLIAEDEVSTEAITGLATKLNAALLHAAEQVFSDVSDGRSLLSIAVGANEPEKTIFMRKTFQITGQPRRVSPASYKSADEAMDAMRVFRDQAEADKDTFIVVKESNGWFHVARQVWASCEFDSRLEAEDAMQAFSDPSQYKVIPVVVVDSVESEGP